MDWSQWGGVDQSAQKWGKKEEKMRRQQDKNGTRVRPAGDQWSLAGWSPIRLWCQFFQKIWFFFFFLSYEDLPHILEEWMYNTSIFWSLPLPLEVLNLPFLIELGDFIFFQKHFPLKLEDT
jgi:hypothetical protein